MKKVLKKVDIICSFIALKMETDYVEHTALWDLLFYAGSALVDWEI